MLCEIRRPRCGGSIFGAEKYSSQPELYKAVCEQWLEFLTPQYDDNSRDNFGHFIPNKVTSDMTLGPVIPVVVSLVGIAVPNLIIIASSYNCDHNGQFTAIVVL